MTIGGATLIAWGFTPGDHFPEAIRLANRMRTDGASDGDIVAAITGTIPAPIPMRAPPPLPYGVFRDANTKDAASVRAQLACYDLAYIVDAVEPYGSIMAGDWAADAPWRNKAVRTGADPSRTAPVSGVARHRRG